MEIMGELDPDPMTMIYLVRHGDTLLNEEDRLRGWDEVPLNDEGKQDAADAAAILRDIPLDKIYTSNLRRAVQTAKIIQDQQKSPPILGELFDLRTIDVGAWTAKPLKLVEEKFLALQQTWRINPDATAPSGESWNQFQDRQLAAWGHILTRARPKKVCVVSHLRCSIWAMGYALLGRAMQGRDMDILNHLHQYSGRVTVMSYSRREGFKLLEASAGDSLIKDKVSARS